MKEMTLERIAELEETDMGAALRMMETEELFQLFTLARRALEQPELWRRVDALAERVLGQPAPTGWVAVVERLPRHGQKVVFWAEEWLPNATPGVGDFISTGQREYWEDETQQGDDGPRQYATSKVRHWYPFQPPEGGKL